MGLANSVRAVNCLRLHGRVPPRIIQHHVARRRQVQAGARRPEAEQKDRCVRVVLESADHLLPVLRLAGEQVGGDLMLAALLFQQEQHPHELAEHQHLLPFGDQRIQQLEQGLRLAGGGVAADELRVAADLAQTRERGEHMYLALIEALLGHRLHHLLAAAAQFGQVKLALLFAKLAVAALFDAVRQILGYVLLEPAQQQRAQLGRQPASGDALRRFGVLATGLVGVREVLLVAQVARLDEIHDAP